MDTRPLPFQKINFVCTNARESGERVCCSGRGSVALHAELKEWVATQGLKRYVRVCKSGCMDRCEDGPNVLSMPDNTWLCGVDGEGLARIKAQLLAEFGAGRRSGGTESA
jgi:(2Fe-2S) ferredoxin